MRQFFRSIRLRKLRRLLAERGSRRRENAKSDREGLRNDRKIKGFSDRGALALGAAGGGLLGLFLGPVGIVGLGASAFALPLILPLGLFGGLLAYFGNKRAVERNAAIADVPAEIIKFGPWIGELPGPIGSDLEILKGTVEHQAFLRNALSKASRVVVIRSAFISDLVVDDRFLTLLARAASRGVRIHLEWGYRMRAAKPKEHEVRAMNRLKRLHGTLAEGQLRLCISPTHVKEISIDDEIAVVGSFNWLSNASGGVLGNRERSVVYRRASLAHDIRLDAELAWENWKCIPEPTGL